MTNKKNRIHYERRGSLVYLKKKLTPHSCKRNEILIQAIQEKIDGDLIRIEHGFDKINPESKQVTMA